MKFQVGDKVVPINKTVIGYRSLDKSNNWRKAKEKGQGFLFVSKFDEEVNAYVCSYEKSAAYGDYFNETDLKTYKDKPTKNQRITALEKEVAALKEEVAALKKSREGIVVTADGIQISPKLTPNQQRKAIIEKAKKFVEETVARGRSNTRSGKKGNSTYRNNFYDVDFFVKGNKVTAVIYWLKGNKTRVDKPTHVGRANCNPSDVFNEHIGKAIALGRALGLDVSEFEQAVQPTLAIGQEVQNIWSQNVTRITETFETSDTNSLGYIQSQGSDYKIINDTNAQYEGVK